jgi:hypothetical protein
LTVNNVLIGNGTNAVKSVAPGTTGNVLTSIGGAWVSNVAVSGAAAGANTQVQYNNSGALAGSANLTFNGTTLTANTLNLTNALGTTYGGTGLSSFTSGGVVYASSSSALATGSALTFDGTNLGLGVTPSAWSGLKSIDFFSSLGASLASSGGSMQLGMNFYYNGSTYIYKGSGFATLYEQFGGGSGTSFHSWYTAPSGTAGNAITFTQAMTLDASGNLLVGKTSSGANSDGSQIYPSGVVSLGHTSGTVTGTAYAAFGYAGGSIGSITQSGTTAVLYNVTSDQRLKENIVDAPEFGSVIDAIKVRSYDWKTDQTHQRAGFIAQELVTVAPEAVHQPADAEEMMAVDYSKFVPMLVKEIQSLRIRIAQLEAK